MEQISHALSKLRRTMSQDAIAQALGISQSTISRWEAGRLSSSVRDALRLIALADKPERIKLTTRKPAPRKRKAKGLE